MGWNGLKNGALLTELQAEGFEVFLTVDQNLRHQQNLKSASVSLVVLCAVTNQLKDLIPLVPELLDVLNVIKPGQYHEIS